MVGIKLKQALVNVKINLEFIFLILIFIDKGTKMGKDPSKPRGKMSSYAYFVQTCREEHKKKHPDASVNFAEFSKKCSERWKVRLLRLVDLRYNSYDAGKYWSSFTPQTYAVT